MIILDFSKAFDRIPHRHLLKKIHHYGIRGNTHKSIESFLFNRSQQVVAEGKTSETVPVISRVPQGSVLGPLLFLMFINDLPENLTSDTRLFDDDAIVYCQIHSVEDKVILQNASKTSRMGTTMGHESSPTKIQLPQNLHIQNTKNIQIHYKICHPSRWNFNEIP